MDYGRLSGKLHSDEDWLGMPSAARELLISVWSWAIDHDKEDGDVPEAVIYSLSAGLGHGAHDVDTLPPKVIEALVTWEWIEWFEEGGVYHLLRWEPQAELIRKARERREKERERYQRRRASEG